MDKTIGQMFEGFFGHTYDGRQDDERARYDFMRLTNSRMVWTQVHGDFKNAAKAVLFEPYPHWKELHECCGLVVKAAIKIDRTQIYTESVLAKLMGDSMTVLMKKYGHRAPKWWIPLMKELRGEKKPAWRPSVV